MKKYFLTIFLLLSINSYSQYTQQWVNRLNGTGNSFDIANTIMLDAQSNSYVYCTLYDSTKKLTDISVLKYSPSGSIVWKYLYNGNSSSIDQLQDVYKDAQNFSYLTGYTSDSTRLKLLLIKLSPQGDTVWTKVSTIPNHETIIPHSVTVDNMNNIYVLLDARNLTTSRTDCAIVKYNQSGTIISQKIIDGSPDGENNSVKILCDSFGNVFAGVNSNYTATGFDASVFKFDGSLNQIYQKRINGTANSDDAVVDMKISNDNNLLLTGKITNTGSLSDIGTFKLNNVTGNILWQKIFNGIGNDIDLPYALTTDNQNNVCVTGYARNAPQIESEDIVVLKYSNDGDIIWEKLYNDSTNGTDQGFSICTDNQNNIYIGGAADFGNRHLGFIALKYNSEGNLLWKDRYRYIEDSEDFVYKIAVNNSQDIFINGISFSNETDYDVTTIKYSLQTGVISNSQTVNDFKLYPNYPNPFNPSTVIRFYNPKREHTIIKIYDINGKEISGLENSFLSEGFHRYIFDARNFSSGIYFYKIVHGSSEEMGKLIYAK